MTALRRFGLLAPLAALSLAGCGLNSVPTAEENVNAKWANVQSEYQRRNDLIGNLVETVKGSAKQEKGVLVGVTEARAAPPATQLSAADLDDPAKVRAFNEAQSQLSQSLIPLRGPTIFEAYPDLKSNAEFPDAAEPDRGHRKFDPGRRAAIITRRCRPITPASAPSPTRSAPRSSTAPSPRSRSKPRRERRQGAQGRFRHRGLR